MKITNLISIKNYEAGKNGNLLVSLDEELSATSFYIDGKNFGVRALLLTAYVSDWQSQETLKKHVDGNTSYDRVIVVNKRFLRLGNRTQRILLERQNAKENYGSHVSNDLESQAYADIACIEKFGAFHSLRAMKKAGKIVEDSVKKVGKAKRKERLASDRGSSDGENDGDLYQDGEEMMEENVDIEAEPA